LPACPVVNDLGARDRQCVVGIDIVEVSEAEQDVVDGLLRVLRLETLDEQCQALVDRTPGSLLDNHQVEVVAELAAVAEYLQFHGHQVAELRNAQAIDLLGWLEKVLGAALVRVQELHLCDRDNRRAAANAADPAIRRSEPTGKMRCCSRSWVYLRVHRLAALQLIITQVDRAARMGPSDRDQPDGRVKKTEIAGIGGDNLLPRAARADHHMGIDNVRCSARGEQPADIGGVHRAEVDHVGCRLPD